MLLWSALGSNPRSWRPALCIALSREKEEGRTVSLREFLAWSVPFTLVASFVCYVLGMLIWVLPYAR
jgi:Flp pilus assembly protein TadB